MLPPLLVLVTVPYPVTIAPTLESRNSLGGGSDCSACSATRMEGAAGLPVDSLAALLSCQERTTLVLDCRPFMSYNAGHVVEAVNVHCPSILKRRSGGFVALENIVPDPEHRERLQSGGYRAVVVYDQCTNDLASADPDSNLYSVMKSLIQQVDVENVFYLVGGYDAFSEDCPLLCVTQQFSFLSSCRPDLLPPPPDDRPVEILPHLFLGNANHSSDWALLQRVGVTALVNVSTSCLNHFLSHFRYLHIPVNDSASEDLSAWFHAANHFIDEVRAEGGRVLVHCHAGRSRSATICLAYLMRTLNLSLDNAFEHVRSRREVIDPNLNFMRQLQDYRRLLDGERGTASPAAAATTPRPPPLTLTAFPQRMDTPRALAPVSLPSDSVMSLFPRASSGADALLLPGSPAVVTDIPADSPTAGAAAAAAAAETADLPPQSPSPHTSAGDFQCFFTFSSTELPFPRSLARTPEIPLPS